MHIAIRIRKVLAALMFGTPLAAGGQAPPATDVFVAPLAHRADGLAISRAVNATNRPGYDNQPAFLRDGTGLLFTSIRDDAQADIYRYDLHSGDISRVTHTTESEYSATPLGDGASFSVVRVEADSTQRLWRFPLTGSAAPSLVLERVMPVGYHAWMDDSTLAMFVLGAPPTLQVAGVRRGDASIYARGIGRGLQRIPGARGVTYVQQVGDERYLEELRFLDSGTGGGSFAQRRLAKALRGQEDFAYTPSGELLAASGNTLYRWSRTCSTNDGWEEVGTLGPEVRNVSRLAVSPDGKWLAFVGEPTRQ